MKKNLTKIENKIETIRGLIIKYEGKIPPCFTHQDFLDELTEVLEDK